MQRAVPEGRLKSLSVPQIFVVETESRHEQATSRRMLMPLQKRQILLLKSSGPMMSDLILDVINGLCQGWIIGPASIVPLGRSYFPYDSRHFVPGYYRAVPPGQKSSDRCASD
jgi:hypothetical protein